MTVPVLAERLRSRRSCTSPGILLVDDDVDTLELTALMLEQLGYRVHQAPNGPLALAMAERKADEIDLLITDIRMPGMNGVELARHMSVQFPQIPIVFVSGYAYGALADGEGHGLAAGSVVLSKPYSVDDLDRCVREALAVREMH